MLGRKREGILVTYYCEKCSTQLALKDENTDTGGIYNECQHFCWVRISKTCYYDTYEKICEPEVIRQLKTVSVLKIDRGDDVYLLIPKEVD